MRSATSTNKGSQPFAVRLALSVLACLILGCSNNANLFASADGGGTNWCYVSKNCDQESATSDWKHGQCSDGKMQSPINIKMGSVKKDYYDWVVWMNIEKDYELTEYKLKNTRTSFQIQDFKTASGKMPTFAHINRGVYTLEQVHIHWGSKDSEGSEHTIDNKSYPLELHMVHYRSSGHKGGFKNFGEAIASREADALSVIGIFFEVAADEKSASTVLNPLISNLGKVGHANDIIDLKESIPLGDLIKVQNKAISYEGSLTTPGCLEIVAWLVAPEPIKIKASDLAALRVATDDADGNKLSMNFRTARDDSLRKLTEIEFRP